MFVLGKLYVFSSGYPYISRNDNSFLDQIAWVLMENRGFRGLP